MENIEIKDTNLQEEKHEPIYVDLCATLDLRESMDLNMGGIDNA